MKYAGFWQRFGAYWIDIFCMLPIMGIGLWGAEQTRLFQAYYLVPGIIVGLLFHVYLVKTYGGTPGKLLLKIKIVQVDGAQVAYKHAFLRYAILFILSISSSIAMLIVVLNMSDELYFSMGFQDRAMYMQANMPRWYGPLSIAMNVWIWSEFFIMLTNKRRRALHDFIAGTVVVKSSSEPNKLSQQDAASAAAA